MVRLQTIFKSNDGSIVAMKEPTTAICCIALLCIIAQQCSWEASDTPLLSLACQHIRAAEEMNIIVAFLCQSVVVVRASFFCPCPGFSVNGCIASRPFCVHPSVPIAPERAMQYDIRPALSKGSTRSWQQELSYLVVKLPSGQAVAPTRTVQNDISTSAL